MESSTPFFKMILRRWGVLVTELRNALQVMPTKDLAMAEVIHRYVRDPLSAEEKAARKSGRSARKADKQAARRLAMRGVASLRREQMMHERTKRLEREMAIAIQRGELIEKAIVQRQAAFLLTALRSRCLSAPQAWARRLLNVSDPREMTTRLREMMTNLLIELADLPAKVTNADWVGD
jgi:hypothetical protein